MEIDSGLAGILKNYIIAILRTIGKVDANRQGNSLISD